MWVIFGMYSAFNCFMKRHIVIISFSICHSSYKYHSNVRITHGWLIPEKYNYAFMIKKQRNQLNYIHSIHMTITLRWRHNGRDSVSNHQSHHCLPNRLFRRTSKKTSKLCVTGLCVGNSPGPVNSPHKWPVTRKMFPFDDVIMTYFPCIQRTVVCAQQSPGIGRTINHRNFDVYLKMYIYIYIPYAML